MYHYYQPVALLPHFFNLFKAELEALGFALVKFFVGVRIVVASGARPPAGAADYNVFKLDAIILQEIKIAVGRGAAKPCYAVPPEVVIRIICL